MAEWIRNRVTEEQWQFVDAQISMVRGRLIESTDTYFTYVDRDELLNVSYEKSHIKDKEELHDLLILRLGMSIGHDMTVDSAVTQVLNWKDGER